MPLSRGKASVGSLKSFTYHASVCVGTLCLLWSCLHFRTIVCMYLSIKTGSFVFSLQCSIKHWQRLATLQSTMSMLWNLSKSNFIKTRSMPICIWRRIFVKRLCRQNKVLVQITSNSLMVAAQLPLLAVFWQITDLQPKEKNFCLFPRTRSRLVPAIRLVRMKGIRWRMLCFFVSREFSLGNVFLRLCTCSTVVASCNLEMLLL